MLLRLAKLFILILILQACGEEEKKVKVPENVLDQETFSEVLVDFTLAESASSINIQNLQRQSAMDSAYAFNPLVDNNIKRETLDTTLYFYCRNPKLFKEVYEMVLEKLSKLQASRK
jgi:hypothetical protein